MGSSISSKSSNISISLNGNVNSLSGNVKTVSAPVRNMQSNYTGYTTEEYSFDLENTRSLRQINTITFNTQALELCIEGLLSKKNELLAKLELATSSEEIQRLKSELFMIDFNIYMLNNQKKLNGYQDIANTDDYKKYALSMESGGTLSNTIADINNAILEKGSIDILDTDSYTMYAYLFETQGKDAANNFYDVILDMANREKGLQSLEGMISLTDDPTQTMNEFMREASDVFNNGGVLSSKSYAELYTLQHFAKQDGTYDATMNQMGQIVLDVVKSINKFNEVPLYKQTDYPDVPYAGGTLAKDGCGITCAAMAISYLKNKECSPADLAIKFSESSNDNRNRMLNALSSEGISCKYADQWNYVADAVKDGHTAIVLLGSGSGLTGTQHFVVVTGVTEDGRFLINDPNYDINYSRSWDNTQGFDNGFSNQTMINGWAGGWILDKKDTSSVSVDLGFLDSYNKMVSSYNM